MQTTTKMMIDTKPYNIMSHPVIVNIQGPEEVGVVA
jgi:hypothetical protein